MRAHKRLLRDIARTPWLDLDRRRGHFKVRRAGGGGPMVTVSCTEPRGRGYENTVATLRRHGMLPDGWE